MENKVRNECAEEKQRGEDAQQHEREKNDKKQKVSGGRGGR